MSTTPLEAPVWFDLPPRTAGEPDFPEWYEKFRSRSWERFCSLPLPTRRDESWRYADLKKSRFEALAFPPGEGGKPSEWIGADGLPEASGTLTFVNGTLESSDIGALPPTVLCQNLPDALVDAGDRLRPFFDSDVAFLGGDKFATLNGSASSYGLVLFVPPGLTLEKPLIINHFIGEENFPVFPRTLIVAGEGSSVSVIEVYRSGHSDSGGLSFGVCDLHAETGAKLHHAHIQLLNSSAKQVHVSTSHAGRDASIRSILVNLGAAWARNESINRMKATGADARLYGANLAKGIQEFDQRTLQIHEDQHTTSDLLIKNALYEQSRIIFGGLIQVLPGAHHTDSFQSCRSLVGSEEAEVNAMPGLEIDADQVRCSHGATSGQISDDELFYLRSRGIPVEKARQMVTCGFLNEAFKEVDDPSLTDWLAGLIEDKFRTIA